MNRVLKFPCLRASLLCAVGAVLLSSCGTSAIRVPVTRPAEVNTATFKKAVVAEINGVRRLGSDGVVFEAELAQALLETGRFEVLDSRAAARILDENNAHGINLLANVRDAGKYIPNGVMISGTISRYDYDEKYEEGSSWKDKSGVTHREYYRKGTFTIAATFQLTDMTDGHIIAAKTIQKSEEAKTSETDRYPDDINRGDLMQRCRHDVLTELIHKIVPYQEFVTVALYSDGDLPGLDTGNAQAKNGFWDDAATVYKRVIDQNANSPKIHKAYYSLGLANMYTNHFTEALEDFKKALSGDPDDYYYKHSYADCQRMASEYQQLKQQEAASPAGTTAPAQTN